MSKIHFLKYKNNHGHPIYIVIIHKEDKIFVWNKPIMIELDSAAGNIMDPRLNRYSEIYAIDGLGEVDDLDTDEVHEYLLALPEEEFEIFDKHTYKDELAKKLF